MAERSAEKILERRRVQNREAQRRFREKKTLQKTLDLLQFHGHAYRDLDSLLQSSPSVDLSRPLPSSCPLPDTIPETVVADITASTQSWDWPTPDSVVADDASLFEYGNAPEDDAASQLSIFPPQPLSTASNNHGILTPDTSVRKSIDCPLRIKETSLSPQNTGQEAPDNTSQSPTVKSASGWLSPLHIAARKGSSRIIRMLVQHNSDCNEPDSEGLTPLIHAVMGGHEEATRSLLECGARVESVQRDGKRPSPSAIHWAVLKRREGVLRVLLDHSSDPKLIDAYDDCGRAPLHIAIDNEFDAGVSLLLQFGADLSRKARQY
ncbi:ankyrin repeat-containing domain protein [Hypoxylon argillaceum]|nr:ankyrin repeat-containing domain protein [Hypoxylon argillaceum]